MSTLNGLDVSHYQAGLDLDRTGLDFAIIKATEGASYVDAECDQFVTQAKKAGMLWGVYHFWRAGVSVTAQADHFIDTVSGYVGDGLLVLDWESTDTGNVAGAKAWLDRVESKTGVRPIIYTSQSVAASHDWSSVSKNTALWVARYNSTIGSTGSWPVTLWQYTSSGHVAGWSGKVDLDHFYGTKPQWADLAAGKSTGGGDTDGDDTMPEYKNQTNAESATINGDGTWHGLQIGDADDDAEYNFLTGPVYATGVLHVTFNADEGTEVNLRVVAVDTKTGKDSEVTSTFPLVEYVSHGGNTQVALPFANSVGSAASGWNRRMRFQVRAWGGQNVTIVEAKARALYWER